LSLLKLVMRAVIAVAAAVLVAACASSAKPSSTATPLPAVVPTSAPTAMLVPPTPVPIPTATAPPTATAAPPTPTPVPPTATPNPPTSTPTPAIATSWLTDSTVMGMYGRGFGIAPILGRLGFYANASEMAQDVAKWSAEIAPYNGGKKILPAIHLIYALAVPCSASSDCLLYAEGQTPDLTATYIVPAQQHGWLVVLDTQLGKSDPVTQVQRMIAKGYLKNDNVEVALDPEFHVVPGHETPGIPVGTITADQVNQVQQILSDYVATQHLAHRKILIVHQFGDQNVGDGVPYMIQNKTAVKDYPNVDLVIMADGFGGPEAKVGKYNKMTDPTVYPFIHFRGIKIFPPNPYEHAGHYDHPMLTFPQIFGLEPTPGKQKMAYPPNVIIIN